MKTKKQLIVGLLSFALLFGMVQIIQGRAVQAAEPSNETMADASPIELGGIASCTVTKQREAHYFKFIVPQNIGNQWITFAVVNYTDGPTIRLNANLLDSQGQTLLEDYTTKNGTISFLTRVGGADTWLDETRFLEPGGTYYIKTYTGGSCEGTASVSIEGTKDDNWGTYDKADTMTVGKRKNGKLEKWDDIDCFSITLPKNNQNYAFNISSDNYIKASFVNGNRILLSEVSIDANKTNNSYVVKGKGQKIYIRVCASSNNVNSANYSLKVTAQKKTISKLSLTSYKKTLIREPNHKLLSAIPYNSDTYTLFCQIIFFTRRVKKIRAFCFAYGILESEKILGSGGRHEKKYFC